MNTDPPVCTCQNQGKVWFLDGNPVISRDPACRVHTTMPKWVAPPSDKGRDVGDWNQRERVK